MVVVTQDPDVAVDKMKAVKRSNGANTTNHAATNKHASPPVHYVLRNQIKPTQEQLVRRLVHSHQHRFFMWKHWSPNLLVSVTCAATAQARYQLIRQQTVRLHPELSTHAQRLPPMLLTSDRIVDAIVLNVWSASSTSSPSSSSSFSSSSALTTSTNAGVAATTPMPTATTSSATNDHNSAASSSSSDDSSLAGSSTTSPPPLVIPSADVPADVECDPNVRIAILTQLYLEAFLCGLDLRLSPVQTSTFLSIVRHVYRVACGWEEPVRFPFTNPGGLYSMVRHAQQHGTTLASQVAERDPLASALLTELDQPLLGMRRAPDSTLQVASVAISEEGGADASSKSSPPTLCAPSQFSLPSVPFMFAYAEHLLLIHSIERPPFSVHVFSHVHLVRLLDWLMDTLIRDLKLHQAALGNPQRNPYCRELHLHVAGSVAQEASADPFALESLASAIETPLDPATAATSSSWAPASASASTTARNHAIAISEVAASVGPASADSAVSASSVPLSQFSVVAAVCPSLSKLPPAAAAAPAVDGSVAAVLQAMQDEFVRRQRAAELSSS